MSRGHRMAHLQLPERNTIEDIEKEIKKNKLVVIVFGDRFVEPKTMQHTFDMCRAIYENKFDIHCYKCVVEEVDDVANTVVQRFKIRSTPTFIFFRNHEEFSRLEDGDTSDPNTPKEEKNPLEYRLKKYLNLWCEFKD